MKDFNILLVDDEPEIIENLSYDLESLEEHLRTLDSGKIIVNIFKASDGLEGFAEFSANDIHCLVTDINLPFLNGMKLAKKIRQLNEKIPIIFLTGFGSEKISKEVFNDFSAIDFVDKPYRFDDLIYSLTEAFQEAVDEKVLKCS